MKKNIPVSTKQLLYLALTMLIPLALAMGFVFWGPPKPGETASDTILAAKIVGAIFLIFFGILAAAASRHAIEITPDTLLIKHSLYTLAVARSEVESAAIREVTSLEQLGVSTRKNGIAAFGYLSGWFWGAHGALTFCAVSRWPVYLVTFEGTSQCRQLALSTSPEIARSIEAWVKRPAP